MGTRCNVTKRDGKTATIPVIIVDGYCTADPSTKPYVTRDLVKLAGVSEAIENFFAETPRKTPTEAHPVGQWIKKGEGFNVYGSGVEYCVNDTEIWRVVNNGSDGSDWTRNNCFVTGGAGAIASCYPYNATIASLIHSLVPAAKCPKCGEPYPNNDLDMPIEVWGCKVCDGKIACFACSCIIEYEDSCRLNECGDLCCEACKSSKYRVIQSPVEWGTSEYF